MKEGAVTALAISSHRCGWRRRQKGGHLRATASNRRFKPTGILTVTAASSGRSLPSVPSVPPVPWFEFGLTHVAHRVAPMLLFCGDLHLGTKFSLQAGMKTYRSAPGRWLGGERRGCAVSVGRL